MKVFISSLISAMEDLRGEAARAVRSLGHDVIRAEDFRARPDSPQIACLAGVREADAVILIMGGGYGAIQSSGLSATHEEYREAQERCPVLVMVQNEVDREDRQTAFIGEVRDWAQGHYTQSFTTADQLLEAVVGALHNLELASATGAVNPEEMLKRAIEMMPGEERRSRSGGGARLSLAIAGGPLQTVLRPAQLEAQELNERLQQMALFGGAAVLTPQQGTEINIENDSLVLTQPSRLIAVSETGSVRLLAQIQPETGLGVILEEDIREIIDRFLLFTDTLLAHIDPVNRISHVAIAAKLLDTDYLTWRTRAEHARSPNSVTMNTFGDTAREPVHLSPPHRTRSALRQNRTDLVDDLIVKLRRQLQNTDRPRW